MPNALAPAQRTTPFWQFTGIKNPLLERISEQPDA